MGRSRTPTLRRYRAGDAGGIGTLVERVFREYGLWRDHKNGLQDLRDIPAAYLRPGGEFLVLLAGPRVIGCGGLQVGRRGAAQVQRMYLDRAWRGRGLGRRLLNGLMERGAPRRSAARSRDVAEVPGRHRPLSALRVRGLRDGLRGLLQRADVP